MNSDLGNKMKVVGLMIILALLLFCAWKDVQRRTEMMSKTKEQEVQTDEVSEPERVVDPNKPMIALTFDDGPSKYTMQLLEELERYKSTATFFMVGDNVADFSDAIKKMKEIGCEYGNHTMHHARLTTLENESVLAEIGATNTALHAVVGETTKLLRPPYGSVNENVATLAGGPLIMWSIDTRDWENKDPVTICNHVLNEAEDGDIILMHDIHETTVQAAIELIPRLIEKGYQLVTVSEMANARGVIFENGLKYYDFKK